MNINSFEDEFNPVETPSLNCCDYFRILPKNKKILYGSTACILVFSFVALVLCCVAVAVERPTLEIAPGLVGGAIAMLLLVFGTACLQVAFYKEKDIIVSI